MARSPEGRPAPSAPQWWRLASTPGSNRLRTLRMLPGSALPRTTVVRPTTPSDTRQPIHDRTNIASGFFSPCSWSAAHQRSAAASPLERRYRPIPTRQPTSLVLRDRVRAATDPTPYEAGARRRPQQPTRTFRTRRTRQQPYSLTVTIPREWSALTTLIAPAGTTRESWRQSSLRTPARASPPRRARPATTSALQTTTPHRLAPS